MAGWAKAADPRHLDLLVASLGHTQANSVAIPGAKEPIADDDAQKHHEHHPLPDNDCRKTVQSLASEIHIRNSRFDVCDSSRCEVELDAARASTGKGDADDARQPFSRIQLVQSVGVDQMLPHEFCQIIRSDVASACETKHRWNKKGSLVQAPAHRYFINCAS